MSRVAIAVVTVVVFLSVVDQSLAVSTRANIKLVNNGYEGILIAIAETVPVSESQIILNRLRVSTHTCISACFSISNTRSLCLIYQQKHS